MEVRTATLRRRAAAPQAAVALLRTRARVPLYRNGYALVASSGLTSVLGLLYWLVAARTLTAEAVGVGAALVSAMTLLANISQLNLKGALNRFLPTAGPASARFVVRSYVVALSVSAAAAGVFIAGLGMWSPELGFLADRPELAVAFVASTMAWTVFVLQDSVLAGIRQAGWVPAENLAFSVSKIVLLVALAGAAPLLGVFVSWSLPVLALVVPVSLLLFRRLIPAHVRRTEGRERPVSLRSVTGYLAADYTAYVFWAGTIGVLPLVVIHVAGAEANAHFFVAWTIAYALYLVSSGMCQSLLAEGALEPDRLADHARRTMRETAALVGVAALAVVALAPTLLGLMGEEYGDASGTLRLLALSAVPYAVVAVLANVARVERRMRVVIGAYGGLGVLVLGLGLPLLHATGIEGLGIAWLLAQTAVAGALVADHLARTEAPSALAAPLGRVLAALRRPLTAWRLRPVLRALERRLGRGERWTVRSDRAWLGEVTVAPVGPADGEPLAMVKRARSDAADASLAHESRLLLALRGRPELDELRPLMPAPLASGVMAGRTFVAEGALPGVPADRALREGMAPERFLAAAEAAIRPLHAATAMRTRVDDDLLREWVYEPIEALREAVEGSSRAGGALARLRVELRDALKGRTVETSIVHGDLWAGNLLLDGGGAVSGIVDWEAAKARGIARVDLLHLLVTTRALTTGRELGAVTADLLEGPFRADRGPQDRALLLLAWLGHVTGNLTKARRYGRSRRWVRRNVEPVLSAVLGEEVVAPAAIRAGVLVPAGLAAAGAALWVGALGAVDLREMSDLGLVSVLPPAFFAALLGLTAAFAVLVHSRRPRPGPVIASLLGLLTALHATPSLLYGTLRYSWSWKHVGVVDYIERHGGVSPGIDNLPVYHSWPGFFGLDTVLAQLAGLGDLAGHAIWGPVFFNLLNLAALVFVLTGLTRDRRVVWIACWLFLVASWVGQDYFSPQAFAFVLYLLLAGVVVRWLREGARAAPLATATLLMAAIAVSHPLTAVMMTLSMAALVLLRASRVWALPLIAGALTVGWNLTFAADYVESNVGSALDSVRLPWTTTGENVSATETLSDGQALVALAGRGLAVTIAILAAVGAFRLIRARRLDRAALALAIAPLALFAAGDYEGEVLFRIYLFAVPFLAFLGAHAFAGRPTVRSSLAFGAVTTAMLGLFVLAYYGKERQFHFTPAEVSAARYLYTHAPPGSLLIEGTRNYPALFENYERYEYVALAREPGSTHRRFASRPVAAMYDWMSDPKHPDAFLIITRSQKAEVAELGVMPPGSLDRIERALLASDRFRTVVHNRDATVFTLARGERG